MRRSAAITSAVYLVADLSSADVERSALETQCLSLLPWLAWRGQLSMQAAVQVRRKHRENGRAMQTLTRRINYRNRKMCSCLSLGNQNRYIFPFKTIEINQSKQAVCKTFATGCTHNITHHSKCSLPMAQITTSSSSSRVLFNLIRYCHAWIMDGAVSWPMY